MAAMPTRNPVSTANLTGHPLHPILVTLPIGFFVAAFLFDLIFWQTGTEAFATGGLWLLGAGLLFTGWKGGEMVFRYRVAVHDEKRPQVE